ncbi:NXPE family member 1-like isoform 3-T3 [Liasis olivaceus]
MLFSFPVIRRIFLMLMLASLLILSYLLREMLLKTIALNGPQGSSTRQSGKAYDQDFCLKLMEDRFCEKGQNDPCRTNVQKKKEEEVNNILARLDQQMPNVTFTDIKSTTSAKNSKATLLNQKDSYCVGEHLLVQLDLYNYLGKKKEYGGDFLRARIFSQNLKAGASGHIKDYRNGTYLVNFTLFWEGKVRVSVLLIHPSEAVSALWAARKKGYDKIAFVGRFLNGTSDVSTECGFRISTNSELCEYGDERDQEAFYCVKPKNLPCEAFVRLTTSNKPVSYLTVQEQSLLTRKKVDIEQEMCGWDGFSTAQWLHLAEPVVPCLLQFGQFWDLGSNLHVLKKKADLFLGRLNGAAVARASHKHTLKYFDTHGTGNLQNLLAVDIARNVQVSWKKHGHPIITVHEYTVKDHSYIAREIDSMAGDDDTVIVVSLGQHFRPFPIELFIRRAINVREAIQRLLWRSPDTKVIIKAENIREMHTDPERFSNFHGYAQYLAAKDIFQDLKIGIVDAWDMTTAYETRDVHPPSYVVGNQINMFLTFIC